MSSVICTLVATLAFRYGRVPGAGEFGCLMGIGTFWSVTSVCEFLATGAASKVFWSVLTYLGSQMTPPLFFVFAVRFCGLGAWLPRRRALLLFVLPLVSLCMAATNHWHGLLWPTIDIVPMSHFLVGVYGRGPWFRVEVAYSYVLLLSAMLLFIAGAFRFQHLYSLHSRLLAFASLFPIGVHILYAFFAPSVRHLDWTPAVFSLSGLILSFGVLRFRLFDIAPVARDYVVENLPDGVVVFDPSGRIADFNPAASRLFGLVRRDMGRSGERFFAGIPEVVTLCHGDGETLIRLRDGVVMEAHVSPLRNGNGDLVGRLFVARDVTERTKLEERLLFLGTHDSLTGLFNRCRFDEELARIGEAGPFPVAVLAFDVDGLKEINDAKGHAAGDALLKRTASVLSEAFGPALVARVGGDEFSAILPGADESEALTALLRLETAARKANADCGAPHLDISAGYSITREGEDVVSGYRQADARMYRAKARKGKGYGVHFLDTAATGVI